MSSSVVFISGVCEGEQTVLRRKRSKHHAKESKDRWRRFSDGGGATPAAAEESSDWGGGDQAERGDAHALSEGHSASCLCSLWIKSSKSKSLFVVRSQDKLQKDQTNAEVNLLKISDQWRTILRQSRGAELRADVTVLSQTFEGHVDILDDIIKVRSWVPGPSAFSLRCVSDPAHWITSCLQTLVRELSEAERQSAQVRQAHLQKMDELRTQQEKQLMHLQQLWDRNMQELISGFSRDRLVRPYSAPCWSEPNVRHRTQACVWSSWTGALWEM